jgi:hypothetical protein
MTGYGRMGGVVNKHGKELGANRPFSALPPVGGARLSIR